MLGPKKYMSATEWHNNWWWIHDNPEAVNAMRDDSLISVQEHQERFASAPEILKDTFTLQDDGSFLVKWPDESNIMEWHLRDLPIVPGIVLKRLFFHQTGKQAKGVVKAIFLWGVFSWQTIIVRKDGIYNLTGKKIMDISIDTEEEILQVNDTKNISYMPMYESMNDYLLQQNKFRFVSRWEPQGVVKSESRFRWWFEIPEDFERQEGEHIPWEILEEIWAQVWSYITGPDLNKNISLITKIDGKEDLNPEAKIFTFKLGKSISTDIPAKAGETLYVTWRVIQFDPNGKEAHFCYEITNNEGQELLFWEIKGNIVPLKILIRAYENIKNQMKK